MTKFMQEAIKEALSASIDVPIGAVIVKDGEIIAKAFNIKEKNNNPTLHAEIVAISEASQKLNRWRLDDCEMYVTLEPCPMCAAAILYARIKKVHFGAYDSLYGAFGSSIDMRNILNLKTEVIGGILEEETSLILKDFFREKR